MRPSTSAGDVFPCFTGQIQVKSIVSEFKDSGSNSPLREWSCPGMISTGASNGQGEKGRTHFFYTMGQMVHIKGRKQRNKDHKRGMDRVLKCK